MYVYIWGCGVCVVYLCVCDICTCVICGLCDVWHVYNFVSVPVLCVCVLSVSQIRELHRPKRGAQELGVESCVFAINSLQA